MCNSSDQKAYSVYTKALPQFHTRLHTNPKRIFENDTEKHNKTKYALKSKLCENVTSAHLHYMLVFSCRCFPCPLFKC